MVLKSDLRHGEIFAVVNLATPTYFLQSNSYLVQGIEITLEIIPVSDVSLIDRHGYRIRDR